MVHNINTKQQIFNLMREGQVEEGIKLLIDYLVDNNHELLKEAIRISYQYVDVKKHRMLGTLDRGDADLLLSTFIDSLIDITIQVFQKENYDKSEKIN